jgi:hypothetical protein
LTTAETQADGGKFQYSIKIQFYELQFHLARPGFGRFNWRVKHLPDGDLIATGKGHHNITIS